MDFPSSGSGLCNRFYIGDHCVGVHVIRIETSPSQSIVIFYFLLYNASALSPVNQSTVGNMIPGTTVAPCFFFKLQPSKQQILCPVIEKELV